jgi:DNA-binding transcriptional LysR family regulator
VNVRVDGQLTCNDATKILGAALDGFGLAYLPEDVVKDHVAGGRLAHVLGDWCPPIPGYHLYYPTRRQNSPAFAVILDALRERGT